MIARANGFTRECNVAIFFSLRVSAVLPSPDDGLEAGIGGGLFPNDGEVNGAPGCRTGFAVNANPEFFLNSANRGVDAHTGDIYYQFS